MALPINELICIEDAGKIHIYKAFYIYRITGDSPCMHGCVFWFKNCHRPHKNIGCLDMLDLKIKPKCYNVRTGKPTWMYKAIRIYTTK